MSVKRYDMTGEQLDRLAAEEARRPKPVGLTPEEVAQTGRRVEAPEPVPVTAIVPHRTDFVEGVELEAEAVAWTRSAVLLRWKVGTQTQFAWVFAPAVRRRRP